MQSKIPVITLILFFLGKFNEPDLNQIPKRDVRGDVKDDDPEIPVDASDDDIQNAFPAETRLKKISGTRNRNVGWWLKPLWHLTSTILSWGIRKLGRRRAKNSTDHNVNGTVDRVRSYYIYLVNGLFAGYFCSSIRSTMFRTGQWRRYCILRPGARNILAPRQQKLQSLK